jgi:peptidoglycan lytic transglycosylase G
MPEDQDWFADTEGNLTGPGGDLPPSTDEFGRDDPAALERERRRREREARRKGGKRKRAASAAAGETSGGGLGRLFGRRGRKGDGAEAEATPPPVSDSPPDPTELRPTATPRRHRSEAGAAPPGAAEPASARVSALKGAGGREGLRQRFRRGRGDEGGGRSVDGGPPRPRGAYRRRRFAALALAFVGILVAWFLVAFFQPPPFDPGDGEGEAIVTVPEGATAGDVATLLTDNDVVSNGTLFQWRLKLAGKSDEILPGRYVLATNMSYSTAIDRLTGSGGKVTVTIPEGEDRTQIAPQVADLGISGDYVAASKSFQGFNPAKYGAKNPKSLEGFLFPATYEVDPGSDVNTLVGQQLTAFQQNVGGLNMSYAKSKNLTVYDVLTIASMIDKEVMVASERPLVAAVIYNRLSKGMPLGIDATTRYQFHNYTGEITQQQLSTPSPYNTRLTAGLPPTPIGNPGLDAIKAAAKPAKVNYLFYVLKAGGNGEHCFTASQSEFDQLVAAYQQGTAPANCRS